LFVSLVKPHKPVTSATIARWLREALRLAGIDVSIFSGHSTSTSAAAGAGITTYNILKAADWSSDSVFIPLLPKSMIHPLVDQYLPLALLEPLHALDFTQ